MPVDLAGNLPSRMPGKALYEEGPNQRLPNCPNNVQGKLFPPGAAALHVLQGPRAGSM